MQGARWQHSLFFNHLINASKYKEGVNYLLLFVEVFIQVKEWDFINIIRDFKGGFISHISLIYIRLMGLYIKVGL